MFPFLDLKFIKIPMYGLCMVIGIYSAFFIAYKLVNNKEKFSDMIIIATLSLVFAVIGAKIVYVLTSHPVKEFFIVIGRMLFTKGNPELADGFVFYGGLIFAPLGYILGCVISKCKIGSFLNEFAVSIPFGHAFGRIGCFCGGCCYGILYEGPFAVVYKNPITSVPQGVGIFPVQLLEALLLFILFAVLLILYLHKKTEITAGVYLVSYSVIRFFLEFLRNDSERGNFWLLSTSQWISIAVFCAGIALLILKNKKILHFSE